jgi:hypothetical protein
MREERNGASGRLPSDSCAGDFTGRGMASNCLVAATQLKHRCDHCSAEGSLVITAQLKHRDDGLRLGRVLA